MDIFNNFAQLHFANPEYLYGLILVPIICLLSLVKKQNNLAIYQKFADLGFLKFLQTSVKKQKNSSNLLVKSLLCLISALIIISIAALRGGYQEVTGFSNKEKLVIAIDLSNSMNASDLYPSRLKYVKAELREALAKGDFDYEIALVAYASAPYVLYPFTTDYTALSNMIDSLSTDIIELQGSNIEPALAQSYNLFKNDPIAHINILLITDGSYEIPEYDRLTKLAKHNINLSLIAVGTKDGSPIPDNKGSFIKENGSNLIAKLDTNRLTDLQNIFDAKLYIASNNAFSFKKPLEDIARAKDKKDTDQKIKIYQEYFYIFALLAMLFMLPFFRRGFLVMVMILSFSSFAKPAKANPFLSQDQNALKAYKHKSYGKAEELFTDKYNKGVAAYRKKDYKSAKEYFAESKQDEKALFNLGNSNLLSKDINEAIKNYEAVLKINPDNEKAQKNLEIAKKLLPKDQQKQQDKKQEKENQQKQENEEENKSKNENDKQQNKPEDGQKKQDSNEDSGNNPQENKEESKNAGNDQKILDMIDGGEKKMLQYKIQAQDQKNNNKASRVRPW